MVSRTARFLLVLLEGLLAPFRPVAPEHASRASRITILGGLGLSLSRW